MLRWVRLAKPAPYRKPTSTPRLQSLERREVPAGYIATGAGPGSTPWVSIRVDIRDAIGGAPPNSLGEPPIARGDGQTDVVSQVFLPFNSGFRGGVNVATGNFDGDFNTPDSLITAAGASGGPHVIVWNMKQLPDGQIVTDGIRSQFFAYDARFRGGVKVAAGDLDGDGRAELITGPGAGGGPHVKIWKEIDGRFQVANEFFAYDPRFTGGVNVASGQGYQTLVQQRVVLASKLPDDFQETIYDDKSGPKPGAALGIPLVGVNGDDAVPPGGLDFSTGRIVPAGVDGHYRSEGGTLVPRNYITVASGGMSYLSGNLLNSYGNIAYRPNLFIDPANNPDRIGDIVFAKWTAGTEPAPPPGFAADVTYGPFVRVAKTKVNDNTEVDVITRLTVPPDQVTFRNQLVVGAGPGGGPHVKIYEFAGTAGGQLINNGVGKEFFAFDPNFTGGVTVAVGDVLAHTSTSLDRGANPALAASGRIDYNTLNELSQRPFLFDTNQNSGVQAFFQTPSPPELATSYQPEVIVGMASQGSIIRVYGDFNPPTFDPTNPRGIYPARRNSLSEINLVPFIIDSTSGVDPTLPFQGYSNTPGPQSTPPIVPLNFYQTDLRRGVANPAQNKGGVNVAVAALNFGAAARFINDGLIIGSEIRTSFTLPQGTDVPGATAQNTFRGFNFPSYDPQIYSDNDLVLTGQKIPVNPVLGQLTVASADVNVLTGRYGGTRVRIFNELSPNNPVDPLTAPAAAWDNFEANRGDINAVGGTVAFGFGVLPAPQLEVFYGNYATGPSGNANNNELTFIDPSTSSSPILI
jgi:hypothetical protein